MDEYENAVEVPNELYEGEDKDFVFSDTIKNRCKIAVAKGGPQRTLQLNTCESVKPELLHQKAKHTIPHSGL